MLWSLLLLSGISGSCLGFRPGATPPFAEWNSTPSRRPRLLYAVAPVHACRDGHPVDDGGVNVSRRSVLSTGAAAALASIPALASPLPSVAVVGGAASSARVSYWPDISSLEPLYEFKLSVDAVAAGVKEPKNWPFIRKRLESFFGGFIINEKNYFMGVGLQYMNDIKYDDAELPNYVLLDKEARFEALDGTMRNLESLKNSLAVSGGGGGIDAGAIVDLATAAQGSLQSFFDLIPEDDVKAVEELFAHVKKADVDGDGKLSEEELGSLSPGEREIWKRRVSKY